MILILLMILSAIMFCTNMYLTDKKSGIANILLEAMMCVFIPRMIYIFEPPKRRKTK